MSNARSSVCERLRAIRRAITDFKLSDLPLVPANASHNASVRIIRSGLAVQCFNILEDFVKERMAELLVEISSSGVQFRHLPEAIQRATVLDVIKAIDFRVRFLDNAAKLAYAQKYSLQVASTSAMQLQLADIAFFNASSNISKDQYRDALKAFRIEAPWTQISGLSSRLSLSALPAEGVFESFATRRHSAAHDASYVVSEGDLVQSLTDAYGLAIGFDMLLTKATDQLVLLRATPTPAFRSVTSHSSIPLRFIKSTPRGFSEFKEGSSRRYRSHADYSVLAPDATARALRQNGALIIYDSASSVVEWHV